MPSGEIDGARGRDGAQDDRKRETTEDEKRSTAGCCGPPLAAALRDYPASDDVDPAVMGNGEAFLARGGIVADEKTCRCHHRDERFRFEDGWPRIIHPGKPGNTSEKKPYNARQRTGQGLY